MFTYSYRIIDRYNSDVVSLAILGDSDRDWQPLITSASDGTECSFVSADEVDRLGQSPR
jgi:hypothetical protein